MEQQITAVRGAIKVKHNTALEIKNASIKLVKNILAKNSILEPDIVSIIFSVTKDLDAYNPATSIRTIGFKKVPLMCFQEASFVDQIKGIIRVLITYKTTKKSSPIFVYLDGAEVLRPDLNNGNDTSTV